MRPLAPYALYALLALFFCWPLFAQPLALGGNDWDQHLFYYGAVLKNVIEYGQAPFWNPWYCGGNVLWQNPQIAILSPVYPLALVMPLQMAMKLTIVLHYWIGFAGMHVLLTRGIGLSFLPAVVFVATLVTAAGATAIHLRVGHSVFLPGLYLPWQIFFFLRACRTGELKWALAAAATLALMVWNGGTHILPMSVAALGTFAVCAAVLRRDWRPLAVVAVFGVAGVALAAPKLLPVASFVTGEQFWDTRPAIEPPDLVTRDILAQTYLTPTQDVGGRLPMQRHGWHEYGNYIGWPSALLLAAGLITALIGRGPDAWLGRSLAITSVVLFLLSLGHFAAWAPASLAQHLPLFENFRIPSRYTIAFLQFAALALAWGLHAGLQRYQPSPRTRAAVAVALLVTAGQLLVTNRWNLAHVFNQPAFDTAFRWMDGPREEIATDADSSAYTEGSPMLRALVEDRAFFYCYESLQLQRAAAPERPLLWVEGTARVSDVTFSPNRIEFNVFGGPGPATLLLNVNWAPGWTSTAVPIELRGDPGKLATVLIPPGQTGRYAFTFSPPGLWAGFGILGVALLASAWAWRKTLPSAPVLRPR